MFALLFPRIMSPDDLLELVEGIRIAQADNYPGHLRDEVQLYRILIKLYRSPEILLRLSKEKVE